MTKRRTRKQKQNARHLLAISWQPTNSKAQSKKKISLTAVKGQKKNKPDGLSVGTKKDNSAMESANTTTRAQVKLSVIKSLFLASLVLGIEVMLYFILQ